MKKKKEKFKDWINSDSLMKRSFAIWVHNLLMQAIVTGILLILFLIFAFI